MVYAYKTGARLSIPAEVAGRELERIRTEQNGFFTPAAVVLASRPKAAPLHPAFEWNDKKAASSYREDQAKYIIRHVVVMRENDRREDAPRAFVSVSLAEEGCTYTSTERAMSEPDLREQVLGAALRDMQAFTKRYSQIAELAGVLNAMEAFQHRLSAQMQAQMQIAA